MNYLLDTCLISELVAKRPQAAVLKWIDGIDERRLYLSVLTLGEIQRGIAKLTAAQRRSALQNWLNDELLPRFQSRILTVDLGVCTAWGDLTGKFDRAGTPIPAIDGLIAATALHHELTLVTRNTADFKHSGVAVINPWTQ